MLNSLGAGVSGTHVLSGDLPGETIMSILGI